METTLERRGTARKPVRFQIKYFYLPPDANPPVTHTIDLSSEGACIETLDPLQLGASVAFFIITPENQVIDARARVVHLGCSQHPPYHAGVRFTYLSPSDRALLERALESAPVQSN